MKKINLSVPYGAKRLKFTLDRSRVLGVLENRYGARGNIKSLLAESLDKPLGGRKLEDLARSRKRILIVVPDLTRRAHLREVLPFILKRLDKDPFFIDVIVATGLHKKLNKLEMDSLAGKQITGLCKVMSHGQDKDSLADLGRTKNNVPVILNNSLIDHDFIISIGVIEPHLYAGYSGGAKTVAIGLAGAETINATHGVDFLDDPFTKIGALKRNPFQRTLWDIAGKISIDFSINMVNDPEGAPAMAFAGETKKVFEEGARFAKRVFEIKAKRPADIVICGVGYPKDANLYQSSRAINYVANVESPVIAKGGSIIIVAELTGGIGDSAAERKFYETLRAVRSAKDFIESVKREGCVVGEHRAYMVAKALLDYDVIFVSAGNKGFMKSLPFCYFETVEKALHHADERLGKSSKIYVIPHALSTIARRL